MIEHILFDLDDTLYPVNAGLMQEISQRMNEFMVKYVGIPEADVSRVRQDYWARYGTTLRGLYIERNIDAQAFLEFVHDIKVDEYLKEDLELNAILVSLPQKKYIFTNAPASHARRVLDALGVGEHFVEIYDINFIEYESKPTQSAYEKVLAAIGAKPETCLMVEDSARNLVPAKSLGMHTVLLDVKATGTQPGEGVDYVIRRIHQIVDVLKELG